MVKLLIRSHFVSFRLISYSRTSLAWPSAQLGDGDLQGAGMRGSRLRGNDGWGATPEQRDTRVLFVFGQFEPLPHLCRARFSGVIRSEAPHTMARFGPVWPDLLLATRASRPWLWPWLASSGVARSGETLNSVAFGCISLLFLSSARGGGCAWTLILVWIPAFAGMTGTGAAGCARTLILTFSQGEKGPARLRGNDVWEQCSSRWGYDVRGSCHQLGFARQRSFVWIRAGARTIELGKDVEHVCASCGYFGWGAPRLDWA